MELEGEDAEDEILEDNSSMILQDDNEKTQLSDEWIYDLQLKNQSFLVKILIVIATALWCHSK